MACSDLIKRHDAARAKKNAFDLKIGILQPLRAADRATTAAARERAVKKLRAAHAALTPAERRKSEQLMVAWGKATGALIKAGCSRGRR